MVGMLGISAVPARADATAFLGITATPSARAVRGFAIGAGLVIVGFEFEYANTTEDAVESAPSLRTGMGNLLLQTPPVSKTQLYVTVGGGLYRERLGESQETHVATNVGGGAKVSLFGPIRLRLDYRVFMLRGKALHPHPQRFYAGVNLAF
ncbi:MAG: hypothetical protein HYX76_14795 [Acidobacteria bacterium]|nr:hypothetical protein [Acidobacteriota bacterium]